MQQVLFRTAKRTDLMRRHVDAVSRDAAWRGRVEASDQYAILNVDAFEWLPDAPPNSVHAVVTDPPYGLVEYRPDQQAKLRKGRGGVWRIPPAFDGCDRRPVPRFTVLGEQDRERLRRFFGDFARVLMPALVPGAHIFVATNPLVSHLVYEPLIAAGFEKRGEIIRLVQTLRGGDRPKNAHGEFPQVSVMPKSCWEPWGLFRKPCEGRVQDNLRRWRTGGLRRISPSEPFRDVIPSAPTRRGEHRIAPHPSLKPQHFLRQLVRAALPFGEGTILDPFMGSGSTIAAAAANGLYAVGLEIDATYYEMAQHAIPRLAALSARTLGAKAVSQRRDVRIGNGKATPVNRKHPTQPRAE
jgi:site-specific DNA-methyltransferase (adenine-specific)